MIQIFIFYFYCVYSKAIKRIFVIYVKINCFYFLRVRSFLVFCGFSFFRFFLQVEAKNIWIVEIFLQRTYEEKNYLL